MQEVSITTEGIQKNLKNFKPLDALCEYIWNGFDAQANKIEIKLHTNQLRLIDKISIIDKGLLMKNLVINLNHLMIQRKLGIQKKLTIHYRMGDKE